MRSNGNAKMHRFESGCCYMGKFLTEMIQSQYHLEKDEKLKARDDLVRVIALGEHNKRKEETQNSQ